MSSSALKSLAEAMLEDLKKTGAQKKGADPQARKALERLPGQVFVLIKERFKEVIRETLLYEGIEEDKITKTVIDGAWDAYISEVKRQESNLDINLARAYKRLGEKPELIPSLVEDRKNELRNAQRMHSGKGETFIITSYDTLKRDGNKAVQKYLESKKFKTDKLGGKGLRKGQKYGAQLGHADEVIGGVAASSLRLLSAERLISSASLSKEDKETITTIVQQLKDSVQLTVEHRQVIDKDGKFLKEYVPVLTYQQAWVNQSQAYDAEGKLIPAFEKALRGENGILNIKGSASLGEAIPSVLLHNLAGKPRKNKKVTGKSRKSEKSSGKGKAKTTLTKTSRVKSIKGTGVSAKAIKSKSKRRSSANNSLFSLATMINEKLPDTVRKNMGPPKLTNVTGRFANSVKITSVARTSKGYPSIGYTYLKEPYQVFEVGRGGSSWATTERDPRKLIDASIREIAANMAIGRFYTRRE